MVNITIHQYNHRLNTVTDFITYWPNSLIYETVTFPCPGNADVGYMGSEILTPNIDTLAHAGVILNQHYVLPQCSPSRAAFVSGRYPIHTGFHNVSKLCGNDY